MSVTRGKKISGRCGRKTKIRREAKVGCAHMNPHKWPIQKQRPRTPKKEKFQRYNQNNRVPKRPGEKAGGKKRCRKGGAS